MRYDRKIIRIKIKSLHQNNPKPSLLKYNLEPLYNEKQPDNIIKIETRKKFEI